MRIISGTLTFHVDKLKCKIKEKTEKERERGVIYRIFEVSATKCAIRRDRRTIWFTIAKIERRGDTAARARERDDRVGRRSESRWILIGRGNEDVVFAS